MKSLLGLLACILSISASAQINSITQLEELITYKEKELKAILMTQKYVYEEEEYMPELNAKMKMWMYGGGAKDSKTLYAAAYAMAPSGFPIVFCATNKPGAFDKCIAEAKQLKYKYDKKIEREHGDVTYVYEKEGYFLRINKQVRSGITVFNCILAKQGDINKMGASYLNKTK